MAADITTLGLRVEGGKVARIELSQRQEQVVERIARGHSDKAIAYDLRISIDTVRHHIQAAAARIPGASSPRHKLTLFFLTIEEDTKRAG